MDYLLSEMVTCDGVWNLDLFWLWLSKEMIEGLSQILLPIQMQGVIGSFEVALRQVLSPSKLLMGRFEKNYGTRRRRYDRFLRNSKVSKKLGQLEMKQALRLQEELFVIKMGDGFLSITYTWGTTLCKMRNYRGPNSMLIRRIHQLLLQLGQWSICHISREDNQVADSLVKLVQDKHGWLQLELLCLDFESPNTHIKLMK
ncbi:hypothetical protein Gotur_016787 [Gossypium turneri]